MVGRPYPEGRKSKQANKKKKKIAVKFSVLSDFGGYNPNPIQLKPRTEKIVVFKFLFLTKN
jgi:hypothetical protein